MYSYGQEVQNHFQFDHLGVLGLFATFECDRTIHIVNLSKSFPDNQYL